MRRTGKFGVAVVMAGLMAVVAVGGASAEIQYRESDFNFAVFSGAKPVTGVVVARQGPGGATGPIRVTASLHRLKAGATYAIVGSTKPCSQFILSEEYRSRLLVKAAPGKTDAFRRARTTTRARLRTIRSVRVYEFVGDLHQPLQLKCDANEVAIESLE